MYFYWRTGTPQSASNTVVIKNPFVLLHEQANSGAHLLGLIKMAAAGMYQQLSIAKRLQPTFTPKKKHVNTNRSTLVNMSENKHCLPFPLSKFNSTPITGKTNQHNPQHTQHSEWKGVALTDDWILT